MPQETATSNVAALKGNAVKDYLSRNRVIEPGTGFTTKPGVAALRRTPGKGIGIDPNPNGVPHPPILEPKQAFAMWNPVGVRRVLFFFPGVRRCHGDPRLCCKTPLGFVYENRNGTV